MSGVCLKFAKKSLKIENFGLLFPKKNTKEHKIRTRKGELYKVSKRSTRNYRVAIN